MKIHEIETMLGVSKANIRFYEKEGLLFPKRKENGYREYDEEDVSRLKQIIVLRKIGIPISDIKDIFDGKTQMQDAVNQNIEALKSQIDELSDSLKLCKELNDKKIDINTFDEDYYWNKINGEEENGGKYLNIDGDYLQFEKLVFASVWKGAFLHDFSKTEKKYGLIGAVLIVLVICVVRGLMCEFVWKSKSFFEAFIYPFELFALVSFTFLPVYLLIKKKKEKAASVLISIICAIALIVLFGAVILLLVGILLGIFG